jgi:predicted DNA repair protein MutK
MPASGFLALLDDIATLLDDVAVLTKVAAKKTAGVLGDDLALNAEQVTGVRAERELPVVWGVFKGSLVNKAILVPAALAISAVAPWAVTPLLMVGGLYLCYEGFEKVAHKLLHGKEEVGAAHLERTAALLGGDVDLAKIEKEKIRGAVRTDFVLSAEIVVIALGMVAGAPFLTRVSVLTAIAVVMTVGVYGLVAAIVKLDDLGLLLGRAGGRGLGARLRRGAGAALLKAAPLLMRLLSVAGTAAMFLVGGGILVHGLPPLHHLSAGLAARGGLVGGLAPTLLALLAGIVAGGLVLAVVTLGSRLFRRRR